MEAGHIAAGALGEVGRHKAKTSETGQVRGRRLALVGGAVIAAFGGAFGVGAATSTKGVAPARLAPAISTAQPAALKLVVSPSVSVPNLVRAPKAKAKPKPKPATVASAPVARAPVVVAPVVAAPVVPRVTPVPVTPTPPVTVPTTHPTGTGTPAGTGTGTVSGSG
jgi:hypothetical protein